MKLLIISDSHNHIANLKTAIQIGQKAGIKAIIHCGDWGGVEAFRAVQDFGIPIYSVLGNADIHMNLEDALKFECKKYAEHLLSITLGGIKIGVIHKVDYKDQKLFDFRVVFSGHYHSQEEKTINWTKFVRPGALVNGINLALYETETNNVEFIKDEQI